MSKFRAGVLALAVIGLFTFFGFTKSNPFSNPFELQAVFKTTNNLKPKSPVRIAGVEIGKVKRVEPIEGKGGASKVFIELKDKALPIHKDAQVKIRPRVFLEGNFFVDIQPGSPSAPAMKSGETVPINQTAAPVQFGDLLAVLQRDTREDLRTLLAEYSIKGLSSGGAKGFHDSIKYWKPAYKSSSLANDATLGEEPTKDLQRVLKGQQRTFAALDEDSRALKGLVTNFNVTAGAFASQDAALEASVPELRDTLVVGQPALKSLNDSLPELRAFAHDALPGVRSSNPTLARSLPFIRQARLLVGRRELRGLTAELRRQLPSLTRLNRVSVPLLVQSRALSACTTNVLVPFVQTPIPGVAGATSISDQKVRYQLQRGFPGLAGESRLSDGNNQRFHTEGVPNPLRVQPAPPAVIDQPPPRRPDVPCETQQPPDLHAPVATAGGLGPSLGSGLPALPALPLPRSARTFNKGGLAAAARHFKKFDSLRSEVWAQQAKKNGAAK